MLHHASKMPHSLRQIGLSYRGFAKLWSAFGSFQPFITNDTVEFSNRDAIFSWKFNAPQCQLCQAEACFIIGSILRGRALFEAGKSVLIFIAFVDAGDVRSRWAIMSKGDEPLDVRFASRHHSFNCAIPTIADPSGKAE